MFGYHNNDWKQTKYEKTKRINMKCVPSRIRWMSRSLILQPEQIQQR